MIKTAFLFITLAVCSTVFVKAEDCAKSPELEGSNIGECCKIPEIFDETSMSECENMHKPADQDFKNISSLDTCAFTCLFKQAGVLTDTEDIDGEGFKKLLEDGEAKNPDWKSKFTGAYEQCEKFYGKNGKQIEDLIAENEEFKKDCRPKATIISFCMFASLIEKCPDSVFKAADAGCNKFKKYVGDCVFN